MAKVLRTFRDAPSNRIVHPGDEIDPSPGRHEELAAGGLVEPPAVTKAAPPPQNKMDPAPENKAEASETVPTFRRARGRPPGSKSSGER